MTVSFTAEVGQQSQKPIVDNIILQRYYWGERFERDDCGDAASWAEQANHIMRYLSAHMEYYCSCWCRCRENFQYNKYEIVVLMSRQKWQCRQESITARFCRRWCLARIITVSDEWGRVMIRFFTRYQACDDDTDISARHSIAHHIFRSFYTTGQPASYLGETRSLLYSTASRHKYFLALYFMTHETWNAERSTACHASLRPSNGHDDGDSTTSVQQSSVHLDALNDYSLISVVIIRPADSSVSIYNSFTINILGLPCEVIHFYFRELVWHLYRH